MNAKSMHKDKATLFLAVFATLLFVFGRGARAQTQAPAQGPGQVGLVGQRAPAGFKPFTPDVVRNGNARRTGHYDPNKMLRVSIAIQPPHWAEEQQFLRDLQATKGSPQFSGFLTAEQWNARFAPSVQDEQSVVDWAQNQGMEVTHRYPNRLLVDVTASAGTLEKAFKVTINAYQFDSRSFFSNDKDPQIPSNFVNIVQAVIGLNNWETMHPSSRKMKELNTPDYLPGPAISQPASAHADGDRSKFPVHRAAINTGGTPNISGGAYDPTDIYSSEAYDYNALQSLGHCCNPLHHPGSSPPEASIAIASVGSQNFSDIAGFQARYSYLAYNVQEFGIDGQSVPCTDATDATCDYEGTLDMEWSTATSNSFGCLCDTAEVLMYDVPNFNSFPDAYQHMLDDGFARVASTSWSCTEIAGCSSSFMSTLDSIFSQMVGQGWTLVAAQGDRGATDDLDNDLDVAFPGSDPNVVSAGGTTLTLNALGNYVSEVTWTGGPAGAGGNDGGTGGGCSVNFSVPSYQNNNSACSITIPILGTVVYLRQVPDIALNADWLNTPQNVYFNGFGGNGGTSIVAPELAGFFAQENAYLLSVGNICGVGSSCAPMGNVNNFLYGEGHHSSAPHYPFYDITSGCNNNDLTMLFSLSYYCAGTGYDLVTGWGSANMLQLAWAINWQRIPGLSIPAITFSGPATNHWYNTDQVVSWTVAAPPGNGFPSDGLSGFSTAWDSDPGDVLSEATPGTGNSFYSGPQFPNGASGCLDLTGASCIGALTQGCHTANVRAWDNEGVNSGDTTYGPLCFDTIPPATTASLTGTLISGTRYKSAVTVKLTATDPGAPSTGSGVARTFYQIDGGVVKTYTAPFTVPFNGTYTVKFYSTDIAGNIESTKSTSFTINAVLALSSAALSFGNQPLNTTSAGKTVTVTNIGSAPVMITAITSSGDFADSNTCPISPSTLAGGAHCTFTVTFTPSVTGSVSGDVTIRYNAEGSPQLLSLTGTGLAPISLSPLGLAFGTITAGTTSAPKTVTLTNNESGVLNITLAASGDYSIPSRTCGATLAGKTSCTMNVAFSPKQDGASNGAVTVTYNAGFSPQELALSGSGTGGVASSLTFSPISLSFSNVVVNTSVSKPVTVKNNSASSLNISGVNASGDYTATGCVTTLLPLATCTMTVTFSPKSTGTINGSVAIKNNGVVNPEIYDVTGSVVSPLNLSPTSRTFAPQSVGTTSAPLTVDVTNNLGFALFPTYLTSGDYLISGGTCKGTLGAHASCTILVSFTPTATGIINGVLTVNYGSTFTPEEVRLSGSGF